MRAAQQEHWACLKAGQWLKATNDDGAFSGQPAPDVGSPEPGAGREAFALVGKDPTANAAPAAQARIPGGTLIGRKVRPPSPLRWTPPGVATSSARGSAGSTAIEKTSSGASESSCHGWR